MNQTKTFMLLAAMTALFMGVGYLLGGGAGAAIAFMVAAAMNLFSYWNADKLVLSAFRARPAEEAISDPRVRAFVEDTRALADRAGLPQPKVYLIEMDQPNAFATGRDPHHAAVAASTGLLRMLDRREVAAVMAHELAHVKNRDTLTMTVTATLAGAIGMLAQFAFFISGGRDRGGALVTLAVMILAPMAAAVVQMAISRAREYEADRIGAEICGDPLALASALERISSGARRYENDAAENNPAMAHLFIMNPLSGKRADNLFSTHPATANRIAQLEAMAAAAGPERGMSHPSGPWG